MARVQTKDGLQDLYVKNIPARIRELFKVTCHKRNISMETGVLSMMLFFIDHPEKVPVKDRRHFIDMSAWHPAPAEPYPENEHVPAPTPIRKKIPKVAAKLPKVTTVKICQKCGKESFRPVGFCPRMVCVDGAWAECGGVLRDVSDD